MEILIKVDKQNVSKALEILQKDDIVSRSNILYISREYGGAPSNYIRIVGDEEQCKRALELTKEIAAEVCGDEKDYILRLIKSETDETLEGFGAIIG